MAITTTLLNQQANYQQDYRHGRKITLSKIQPSVANEQNTVQTSNTQKLTSISFEQLQRSNTSLSLIERQLSEPIQDIVYQRPLTGRVKMMKLILESTFNETISLVQTDLSNKIHPTTIEVISKDVLSLNNEFIETQVNLGRDTFRSNDRVTVEEWQAHQQELNYNMQGEFNINGKNVLLDYSFHLASNKIQYNSYETDVAALKDPLLVQFGQQGLGDISGQVDFDINQDNKTDKLPTFSGDIGYLVYDKNSNNRADNGSELFGPTTGNGFSELAQLDDNNNGFLDKEDSAYQQLYLWQPEKNTWLSLAEAEIEAISTVAIATPYTFYNENDEVQAQLRYSSFAISESGRGFGVHHVDVKV